MRTFYIFLFSIATLGGATHVQAAETQVYEFRCLPEVRQVQINTYSVAPEAEQPLDFAQLKEKGLLYPLWSEGAPEMFHHSCSIEGKTFKVHVDGVELTEDKHGQPCRGHYGYLLRLNAWVDDKPIVEDLLFDGGCTEEGFSFGEHLYNVRILPVLTAHKTTETEPDIYINIDMAAGDTIIQMAYPIKFEAPYDPDHEGWVLKGRPLTSTDVHEVADE